MSVSSTAETCRVCWTRWTTCRIWELRWFILILCLSPLPTTNTIFRIMIILIPILERLSVMKGICFPTDSGRTVLLPVTSTVWLTRRIWKPATSCLLRWWQRHTAETWESFWMACSITVVPLINGWTESASMRMRKDMTRVPMSVLTALIGITLISTIRQHGPITIPMTDGGDMTHCRSWTTRDPRNWWTMSFM